MVSYAKRALQGAAIVFILSMFSAVAIYLFRILLARNLSVADYGLFFALMSFIGLLGLFKDLGLGYALLKFVPEFEVARKWDRIKSLISSSFLIQLISSGIIMIIIVLTASTLMERFFHSSQTNLLILFSVIFFSSFPQQIVAVSMQSFQKMFLFAAQDLTRNLLLLVLTFVLLSLGLGIMAPSISYLVMYVVVFLIFFFIFTKKVFPRFWSSKTEFRSENFSSLLLFGLPAMMTIFGSNVLQYIDTLMLTYFTDLDSVGIYQVAVPLAALVLYLANAVSVVVPPLTSELMARKKNRQLKAGIELLHKYLFIAVIPISVILIAFPEIFIRLFFGDKFLPAALALRVLGFGSIFYTLANVNMNILFGLGKPRYNTMVMIATAALNVILNLILIPKYGIVGAASGTATSYLFMLVMSSQGIKKVVKIKEPWYVWSKILVAALLFAAVIAGTKALLIVNPWIELIISLIVGGCAYCLLLFALKITTKDELRWIASQLRQEPTQSLNNKM